MRYFHRFKPSLSDFFSKNLKKSLLIRNRNFRLLYCGQFVSLMGTLITQVALPYQIYYETKSVFMVGFLSLFQLLPLLLTALLGGVLADKYPRRLILLISESLLAMGCLLLIINASLTNTHIWVIFVVATIMSAVTGLHRPALDSIVQQIVAKPDFIRVSRLSMFMYSTCMIVGPAIGGLMIAQFGLTATLSIDFASFVVSFMALLQLKAIRKPIQTETTSIWTSLQQGFRYAASRQELMGTYFVDFIAMVFGMPMALFPAISETFGGVHTLGMLYSAPAVGSLVVSLSGSWANKIKRQGCAIAVAASLWGVAIIFFGFSTQLYFALFFLSLAGAFDAISGIFRTTMWNQTISQDYRGRLSGIEMISYLSGPKLGDMEAGLVAAAFGITASVVSGGVLCVLGVIVCSGLLPKFWQYRSDE